jgi:2-oxoisovalerate dehydrogenase E1 component
VLDLRWLNPLPFEAVRAAAADFERVLVVDECRATGGGVAEALLADLAEHGYRGRLRSVRAADCYVPLGSAASTVLVGEDEIAAAIASLCAEAAR